ncbi:MAG: tetratricopeptide repeat protein [Rhizobiaceae bacterium]|nr:tetratricopeptide repeat protein [Rhizobiaceae bacterium]
MAQFENADGLKFTASSAESASQFSDFTSSYMGFRRNTGEIVKNLAEADPDMPMALCARGYLAKLFGSTNQSARAKVISGDLENLVRKVGANEREKQHAAALAAWCDGDLEKTTELWEGILLDDPMDGLALRLSHFTHFYSGDPRRMRDSIARILPLWSPNHRDYGFLLGMYAFGLEESGEYAKAEHYGREAVARNPADAWSVHSVAHVLEMTERMEEGIAWVNGLEQDWSTVNNFRFHLYWHRCLYHLERGEFDVVLELYDQQIVSDIKSDFYLDICNASSLLWRLEMFGVDIGDRWSKLVEVARKHVEDTDLIFVSLHYLMALVAAGDKDAADRMIANIQQWSTLNGTQAQICAESGLALAKGLKLAREGNYKEAARLMEPVRYTLDRIGGSRAQRDVFHMILLDVTKASQDILKARALFAERLAYKVHSSWSWKNYGEILHNLGRDEEAIEARSRAASLIVAG